MLDLHTSEIEAQLHLRLARLINYHIETSQLQDRLVPYPSHTLSEHFQTVGMWPHFGTSPEFAAADRRVAVLNATVEISGGFVSFPFRTIGQAIRGFG